MAAAAAGRTILAPTTELAAALFDEVERSHRDAGLDLWSTPRVRDFRGWLKDQYIRGQLQGPPSPRVLSDVEESELWRVAIETANTGVEILEPSGAVRAARRARRALYEYGIPLEAVAAHGAGSDESQALLAWNRRFNELCRELDRLSGDELMEHVAPRADAIAWIDSPLWRPMARRWLSLHGAPLLPAVRVPRTVQVLRADSAAAELAAIAEWAAQGLQSDGGFRAWVYLPDLNRRRAQVIDALDAVLAPQRFGLGEAGAAAPYAVAGGTPLADFAPVRAALQTLEAGLGPMPFERFSALLRLQALQDSHADAAAAAHLDVELRRVGPAQTEFAAWLSLCERLAQPPGRPPVFAVQRLTAALRALEEQPGSHAISRWVPAWIRALEAGPWALRHRWSSSEYQAAERFRELLAAIATSDAFFGTLSRGAAQRILLRAARETPFQAQTGVPAVWVTGQPGDPWLNYDGIWIGGYDDQRWPPPVQPIPLIPLGLQREFGVIACAAESQLRFALELQNRWSARAVQCVFSHADPGDGRMGAHSPLLPPNAVPRGPAAAPRPHWHALYRAAPAMQQLSDESAPPFAAGDERTRGVSTLRAQSRCAFRGFAETRMRTDRLERPTPGFNDRERGNLVHHALQHVWSVLLDSKRLHATAPDALSALLDEAVARAIGKVCRLRDPGPRWRARERVRLQGVLREWLEAEKLREPFAVESLEQGSETARHAGLAFDVRIDRVDRAADGGRILIDYKTGAAAADWRGDRPDNPQLPIYALLRPESLIAVAYGRVNAEECGFVAETERAALFRPRGRPSTLEGMPSLAALLEVWSRRIAKLAAEFSAGHAAVAPTPKACKSCHLQGLCRVPAGLEDGAAPS